MCFDLDEASRVIIPVKQLIPKYNREHTKCNVIINSSNIYLDRSYIIFRNKLKLIYIFSDRINEKYLVGFAILFVKIIKEIILPIPPCRSQTAMAVRQTVRQDGCSLLLLSLLYLKTLNMIIKFQNCINHTNICVQWLMTL